MSINIKNREAEALIAELKRRTGQGTTDLLLTLLREAKSKSDDIVARGIQEGMENARRLQSEWRGLPPSDARSIDEIVPYDDNGLPR